MKRAMAAVQDYERQLVTHLIDGLRGIGGLTIVGITDNARYGWRVPTVAVVKEGISPDEIAAFLAEHHVYVWSGNYYALEIVERLNRPEGMVRIGIGQYNTIAEIDRLLNLMEAI